MADIKAISIEAGYLLIDDGNGPPRQLPVADLLRAADIPTGLTHTQVAAITALANLTAILIRTLIERKVLDEDFIDSLGMNWDLEHLSYAIGQMGGSYDNPDLDDIED